MNPPGLPTVIEKEEPKDSARETDQLEVPETQQTEDDVADDVTEEKEESAAVPPVADDAETVPVY